MTNGTKAGYGQPALIGGLVMGVLSALPFVSVGNACCCLWVLAGGMAAAYVLQQNTAAPIEPADGALVGLLAGLIGAVVTVALSIPIDLVTGPMQRQLVQRILDMARSMPPDVRDRFERFGRAGRGDGALFVVGRVVALFFWIFIGAAFVAMIARNLNNVEHVGNRTSAAALAESGLNWVNTQLTYSELGADWRPSPTWPTPLPPAFEATRVTA